MQKETMPTNVRKSKLRKLYQSSKGLPHTSQSRKYMGYTCHLLNDVLLKLKGATSWEFRRYLV